MKVRDYFWGFLCLFGVNYAAAYNIRGEVLNTFRARVSALEKETNAEYFFYLFAYEGDKKLAEEAHTFASFIQVDRRSRRQDWSTISWYPKYYEKNKKVCIFKNLLEAATHELKGSPCAPEEGKNYSLEKTLEWAGEPGKKLYAWGPYAIEEDFYYLGLDRIQYLNSGAVKFLADDRKTRLDGIAINCMRAVSDLNGTQMPHRGFLGKEYGIWGLKGSSYVLEHLLKHEFL